MATGGDQGDKGGQAMARAQTCLARRSFSACSRSLARRTDGTPSTHTYGRSTKYLDARECTHPVPRVNDHEEIVFVALQWGVLSQERAPVWAVALAELGEARDAGEGRAEVGAVRGAVQDVTQQLAEVRVGRRDFGVGRALRVQTGPDGQGRRRGW